MQDRLAFGLSVRIVVCLGARRGFPGSEQVKWGGLVGVGFTVGGACDGGVPQWVGCVGGWALQG